MNAPFRVPTRTRTPLIAAPPVLALLIHSSPSTVCRTDPPACRSARPRRSAGCGIPTLPFSASAWKIRSASAGSSMRDVDREALRLLIVIGRRVGAHQDAVAHLEAGMHDLVAPFGRRLRLRPACPRGASWLRFCRRGLLVKLESGFAFAVEDQVSIQLHNALLWTKRSGLPFGGTVRPQITNTASSAHDSRHHRDGESRGADHDHDQARGGQGRQARADPQQSRGGPGRPRPALRPRR